MFVQRFRAAAAALSCALLSVFVLGSGSATAGQCIKDHTKVPLDGANAIRVKQYVCRSEAAGVEGLLVEFHRLDDLSASMVLFGPMVPQLEAIFGGARIRQNSMFQEYKSLVDNFGIPYDSQGRKILLDTSNNDSGDVEVKGDDEGGAAQRLDAKFSQVKSFDTDWTLSMPMPDVEAGMVRTDKWPKGWKVNYPAVGPNEADELMPETTMWRYLERRDLENYDANWRRESAKWGGNEGPTPQVAKQIALLSHLTRDNFPEDFMVIEGHFRGCGEEYALSYSSKFRNVYLELALVKNTSGRTIVVDNFIAGQILQPLLRLAEESSRLARSAAPVGSGFTLAAGESVVVPLRIVLEDPNSVGHTPTPREELSAAYRALKSFSKEHLFSIKLDGVDQPMRKKRRYFKKPKPMPPVPAYVYGPESYLAGFRIDGQDLLLEDNSGNFLGFSVGNLQGSCPFLYAWNDKTDRWNGYGKVIHQSHGRDREASERVKLDRFATRFRLTEHELELSQINRLALLVGLKDGREIVLLPEDPALAKQDKRYRKIFAGASLEFSFKLPEDVKREDVVSSHLDVTGYYRLYTPQLSKADLQ
ncbi:MAG: hypothetical protein K0U74_08765 [Alphaproteobacteria bacterium]|nr:hypothetical protein [Alphaproteobacteria bacterium]